MTIQTLTLQGERYVVMREKDYRALTKKNAAANGRSKQRRLTAQDRGDIAEARRRLADPSDRAMPYAPALKRERL